MDSASGCPIQIGSKRSPSFSCRMTTYEFEVLSRPSRATLTSTMGTPGVGRRASRPHVPGREILLLLGREDVDPRTHGCQLEPRNLAIDCLGHAMDILRQ